MDAEILIDEVKPPAQNNLIWEFPVKVGDKQSVWQVDSFDLDSWFTARFWKSR
jgi:hypothetical protein